jgi:MFS family permease
VTSVAATETADPPRPAIWSWGYVLLLAAMFCAYAGQRVLIPILPLYIIELGGTPVVAGLVLAAFSLTSFPTRPLAGYLSDSWSARGALGLGNAIMAVTSLGYFVPLPWVLAGLNAVQGFGWAAINTAGYVVLLRAAPTARRGEASSYYNLSMSLPGTLAPGLALWMVGVPALGFPSVWLLAAACGAIGFATAWCLRWVAPHLDTGGAPRTALSVRNMLVGLVDRRVFLAAGLLLSTTITSYPVVAFLPLYARELGVEGVGLYFVVTGVVGMISNLTGARLLDRGSRGAWILAGFALLVASMLVLAGARSLEVILLSGFIHAVGNSILSAMLLVLAMDLADPERPGAGLATYSMAYQLGAALGAPTFGFVIQLWGFGPMFVGCALTIAMGLLLTLSRTARGSTPAAARAGRA